MKKLFALLCLFTLLSCKTDPPEPLTELEKLPSITFEGKRVFGCLIDGKAYVPKSLTAASSEYVYKNRNFHLGVGGTSKYNDIDITFNISLTDIFFMPSIIEINSSNNDLSEFYNFSTNCEYWNYLGELELIYVDTINYIVSGKFEFEAYSQECLDTVQVTDGRFDLHYVPSKGI